MSVEPRRNQVLSSCLATLNQADHEENQENHEEHFGNPRGGSGDAGETEHSRDNRDIRKMRAYRSISVSGYFQFIVCTSSVAAKNLPFRRYLFEKNTNNPIVASNSRMASVIFTQLFGYSPAMAPV